MSARVKARVACPRCRTPARLTPDEVVELTRRLVLATWCGFCRQSISVSVGRTPPVSPESPVSTAVAGPPIRSGPVNEVPAVSPVESPKKAVPPFMPLRPAVVSSVRFENAPVPRPLSSIPFAPIGSRPPVNRPAGTNWWTRLSPAKQYGLLGIVVLVMAGGFLLFGGPPRPAPKAPTKTSARTPAAAVDAPQDERPGAEE